MDVRGGIRAELYKDILRSFIAVARFHTYAIE